MTDASRPSKLLETYLQSALPWSLYPASSLAGTILLPLPPAHPQARIPRLVWNPYPKSFDKGMMIDRSRVLERALAYEELVEIARDWFRVDIGSHSETGGVAALIRVLSVLSHLTDPRRHRGDPMYDCNRFLAGFAPVPGGNLHTLLWLGYRYVQAFAAQLRTLDKALAKASGIDEFNRHVTPVLISAAKVPGHDLLRSRDGTLTDDDLSLWPEIALDFAVKRAESHLMRAVRQARRASFADARTRLYPIRSPRVRRAAESPSHLSDAQVLRRNFRSYVDAATDILGSVVELLRLSGHVALMLVRYLAPTQPHWGLAQRRNPPADLDRRLQEWRRIAAPLSPLAELPPDLLDCHFVDSWRDTELPLDVIVATEAWLVGWLNREGWRATALSWGVLPGDCDSLNYAGRCRPLTFAGFGPEQICEKPPGIDLSFDHESRWSREKGESTIAARLWARFAACGRTGT